MLIPIRRLAPAVLLLVTALCVVACGGSSSGEDVESLLDKSFKQRVGSADLKLEAELELNGLKGLNDPIRLRASGPYRTVAGKIPAADLALQIGVAGQKIDTGFLSTGDRAFVRFQDVYYEQPKAAVRRANQGIAAQGKKARGSLRALGLDPRRWLEDAEQKDDEEVAGVKTEHVSGKLDIGRVVADLNDFVKRSGGAIGGATGQPAPQPLSGDDIDRIKEVVKNPDFDVYVGKEDGIIRRISGRLEFDVPEESRKSLAGLEGGSLSFSFEFTKVNGDQRIEAPANARPLSDLTNSLGAGALGGLSGGAGSGTSTTPGASSDAQKKYNECLDAADPGNTDAIQRCSELLP